MRQFSKAFGIEGWIDLSGWFSPIVNPTQLPIRRGIQKMEPSVAGGDPRAKDPHLPPLHKVGDIVAPKAPQNMASAQLEDGILTDLVVKMAYTTARFTTDWVGKQLHLSPAMVSNLLEKLCFEGTIEQLWQTSQASSHYKITTMGQEHATRCMDICGYIGPAPVSLDAYSAMLRWQFSNTPQVLPENVVSALSGLILPSKAAQMAGLAVSSGRSMFVFGPSGNGKSSLGRQIHAALPGDYWIPYAISVGESVIRLYDGHIHQKVEVPGDRPDIIDQRWVRIRRPMVIVGGELTLDMLDVIYMPSHKYYKAHAALEIQRRGVPGR